MSRRVLLGPLLPVPPSNRFVRLARLASPKQRGVPEDFFTEALAAALEEDPELRTGFAHRLLTASDDGAASSCHVRNVATQVAFANSRLDIVLELSDGRAIGVENKLDAQEGDGQLLKYLALPDLALVAFIAPTPRSLEHQVVAHPKYLASPGYCRHFLWADFYASVASTRSEAMTRSAVRRGLVGLFDYLGHTPPLPIIGNVQDPDPEQRAASMKRIDLLLRPARDHIHELGYKPEGFWQGQITTRVWRGHSPSKVWIDGFSEAGLLSVRLYYPTEESCRAAEAALAAEGALPTAAAVDVYAFPSTRKDPDARHGVKVVVSLQALLLNHREPTAAASHLHDFVAAVMRAAARSEL